MPDKKYSINNLNFIWDEEKNKSNQRKHGISFETAALVFNDSLRLEFEDILHSQDETRYNVIGLVHDVLFVVYTDGPEIMKNDSLIRIISARPAKKTETEAYNNNVFGR